MRRVRPGPYSTILAIVVGCIAIASCSDDAGTGESSTSDGGDTTTGEDPGPAP